MTHERFQEIRDQLKVYQARVRNHQQGLHDMTTHEEAQKLRQEWELTCGVLWCWAPKAVEELLRAVGDLEERMTGLDVEKAEETADPPGDYLIGFGLVEKLQPGGNGLVSGVYGHSEREARAGIPHPGCPVCYWRRQLAGFHLPPNTMLFVGRKTDGHLHFSTRLDGLPLLVPSVCIVWTNDEGRIMQVKETGAERAWEIERSEARNG